MKNSVSKFVSCVALCFVMVLSFTCFTACSNSSGSEGSDSKGFVVEITASDYNLSESFDVVGDYSSFGDYLRNQSDFDIDYSESEYGIYIVGIENIVADSSSEEWWMLSVDGDAALTGADGINIEDGSVYTISLERGW